MDYHLDWIYASLYLHRHGGNRGPHPNAGKLIRAQQEDVDLLVAYKDQDVCRLILLEAKGASSFGNEQFRSKTARFREIFGTTREAWSGVVPYFILTSPRRPRRLDTRECPTFRARARHQAGGRRFAGGSWPGGAAWPPEALKQRIIN